MSHVIIGTAGHVDHGKTALIKALTGEETDRLQEEKDRGISIELGFAPFRLPSGRLAGVVDVPGHERFIHNMLAGIGGIDLVLLVVDVTEGVMPQTREHVEIMDLLQVARGIVVLAKADLAEDEDWLDLVEEEVSEALAGTFLQDAPFFRVSAHTGRGMDQLLTAIDDLTGEMAARDDRAPLRMPVDRVFSIAGFGTIVTGTLLAGKVTQGMTVDVLPLKRNARVRQIQVHGDVVNEAVAGQRAAVNLSGLEKEALPRGSVVAAPGSLDTTYMLDTKLKLLSSAPRIVKNLTRVHVYLGTGRSVGRIALLDRDELKPGDEAPAQLRLEKQLVAQSGDRFIVRSFSPMTTIGGGLVLDAGPVKHKRFKKEVLTKFKELEKGDPAAPVLQRIRREYAVAGKVLEKQAGLAPELLKSSLERLQEEGKVHKAGDLWVDAVAAQQWEEQLISSLEDFHRDNHLAVGRSRAELRSVLPKEVPPKVYDWLVQGMVEKGLLTLHGDLIALTGHRPTPSQDEQKQLEQLAKLYQQGEFKPPTIKDAAEATGLDSAKLEKYLEYLAWQGTLVRLDDQLAMHADHFARAKAELCRHFKEKKTLAAGEFRERLGSTRKFVVPLLENFDRLKWTRRMGDERVPWRLDIENCGEEG
ncbi:selenocysteine-specific translation elongation factor [Dethiobacter alkaliphilus]|uniref:selenocysteine-specific translation elongation factor n=1 Tax=Dethiobacter alkaliphilus TaxID=427926 RepID=UPI002226F044|nr:selenocysteine-specific translation elongation factor [Dethiobacter alkaliphilus]MCW3489470.1 selenocysteine-specific translation elongation factor [Dethiobacter alkaliphilus]